MPNKTALFVRKQPGGMYAVVDNTKVTGNIWFVDSGLSTGADASGYGQNPDAPFLTLDYAIGAATANNGDYIFLMPGHAETLTTAGDVAIDKAGLTIIGIGEGADRPTFTFSSSDNSASILITAASTTIKNIIGVCGDDGLTNPFHVQAADCTLDIEWQDGSATVEAAAAVVGTDAADRLNLKLKYIGFTGGNACVNAVLLDGSNQARIDIDFFGKASTAIVEFNDTAVVDVNVTGYFYNSGTTDLSKNIKDTATGSTWFVQGYDGAAGCSFSGGSGASLAKDDVSVVAGYHSVPTANAETNAQMRDGIGNKTDAAVTDVGTTKSIMAYAKGLIGQATIGTATGNADIDISEAVYTAYVNIMTITAPASGLADCSIDLDLNKATTGWDTISTASDTIDICLAGKIDGTNYRALMNATQVVAVGDGTIGVNLSGIHFHIGPLAAAEVLQVQVKLSAERDDVEIPYRVTYVGAAPTVTPVAAA